MVAFDVGDSFLDERQEFFRVGQDPEPIVLDGFEDHVADLVRVHASRKFTAKACKKLIFELDPTTAPPDRKSVV